MNHLHVGLCVLVIPLLLFPCGFRAFLRFDHQRLSLPRRPLLKGSRGLAHRRHDRPPGTTPVPTPHDITRLSCLGGLGGSKRYTQLTPPCVRVVIGVWVVLLSHLPGTTPVPTPHYMTPLLVGSKRTPFTPPTPMHEADCAVVIRVRVLFRDIYHLRNSFCVF